MKRQNGRTEKLGFLRKLRRYFSVHAEIERLYKVSDSLEPELIEGLKLREGRTLRLGKNSKFGALLEDNFKKPDGSERNKVYRSHGITRFSIKRVALPWP